MQEMMKAAVVHAQNDIRYEDFPAPEMRPGHVKIRVRACGICGSDIPRVLGKGARYYPIVLGHEFSGEIVEVAEDVKNVEVGDRVVCAALVPCYNCPDCAVGNYSLCKNYIFIGSRVQGGFADYVVVPAGNVVKFSPEYSFEEAALTEPASVALHGILVSEFRGGGKVAVVGAGTIGVLTAMWAKLLGAAEVVLFDIDDDRLALAKEVCGCDGVNTMKESIPDALARLTGGRGFSEVFGVSGAPASDKSCLAVAANKASVCYIGTPTGDVNFSIHEWEMILRKELRITGSWMSYSSPFPGREWTMTADYLSSGKLKLDRRLIYKEFTMDKCKEAFDCYLEPEKVKGRIMLVNKD